MELSATRDYANSDAAIDPPALLAAPLIEKETRSCLFDICQHIHCIYTISASGYGDEINKCCLLRMIFFA